MLWILPVSLMGLVALAFQAKEREALFVSSVLLANWIINTIIVYVSGLSLPWPLFMAVDYISAVALLNLNMRLTKCQIAVAIIYGIQMVAHCAYGLSDHKAWPQYRYYYVLLYLAWAQCALVGGWLGLGPARRFLRSRRGSGDVQHLRPSVDSVGQARDGADQ